MEEHSDRNRGVADKNEPGENLSGGRQLRRQLFVVQAQRLKKARGAMTQMQREQKHPQHIETRDEIVLKTVNHHRVNVVAIERVGFEKEKARIRDAHCEV